MRQLMICLSLVLWLSTSPTQPRELPAPANWDATNVSLVNVRVLDEKVPECYDGQTWVLGRRLGRFPRFSPKGDRILFNRPDIDKTTHEPGRFLVRCKPSLWLMDPSGENKTLLLSDASNGVWSPDGRRIAFEAAGRFHIYDIASHQRYDLIKCRGGFYRDCAYFLWSKDGQNIGMWDKAEFEGLLSLDNLEFSDEFEPPEFETLDEMLGWYATHFDLVLHRAVTFRANTGPLSGTTRPLGIWVANRNGRFERLLYEFSGGTKVPAPFFGGISLSPDLSIICFEDGGDVHCGDLVRQEQVPQRTFQIGLQPLIDLCVKNWDEDHRPQCTADIRQGVGVVAECFGPKRNPLNNTVIGPNDTFKATVRIETIEGDHAVIRVVSELRAIALSLELQTTVVPQRCGLETCGLL